MVLSTLAFELAQPVLLRIIGSVQLETHAVLESALLKLLS